MQVSFARTDAGVTLASAAANVFLENVAGIMPHGRWWYGLIRRFGARPEIPRDAVCK
jgi:hypothetical protein